MSDPITKKDVEVAVEEGVKKALIALGIDHENVIDTQEDMAYLRRLRKGSQALTSKVAFGVVGAMVTAMMGIIVAGFFSVFGTGHPN